MWNVKSFQRALVNLLQELGNFWAKKKPAVILLSIAKILKTLIIVDLYDLSGFQPYSAR